jgi:hypothetical protein
MLLWIVWIVTTTQIFNDTLDGSDREEEREKKNFTKWTLEGALFFKHL